MVKDLNLLRTFNDILIYLRLYLCMDIEGKCQLMCPERERKWREKNDLLHRYETIEDSRSRRTTGQKADPAKTVKQYSRPAAGRNLLNSADLRPLPVLRKTVSYMIECIMNRKNEPWIDIYEFCSDRLRSVCQDLTIQRISGKDSAWVLECAVRFYIFSDYRLFKELSVQRYDSTINSTLLMECLKRTLSSCVEHSNSNGGFSADDSSRSSLAEMAAVYVIFNLDSEDALLYALSLNKSLRSQPSLSTAIRIGLAYHLGNYLIVLRSLDSLSALLACCLHRHLQCLRKEFLFRLSCGFSSKVCRFPLDILSQWLQIHDTRQTQALCTYYGLTVEKGNVVFLKTSFQRAKTECFRENHPKLDQKLDDLDLATLIGRGQAHH